MNYKIPDMVNGYNRPPIVCLCGSARFKNAFVKAGIEYTWSGYIVLTIGCDAKSDEDIFSHLTIDEFNKLKTKLDYLHKRKIDLADEIFVLNVGGYVGESTQSEIDYAHYLDKPIKYLESNERITQND